MIRSIISTIVLALIAVHVAAGEDDLPTQVRALQKERLETLTEVVKIYTLQYEAGKVSSEVFADAQIALANAQLDAALVNVRLDAASKLPDSVITVVENVARKQADAAATAAQKDPAVFVETKTALLLWHLPRSHLAIRLAQAEKNEADIKERQKGLVNDLTELVENYRERYKTGTASARSSIEGPSRSARCPGGRRRVARRTGRPVGGGCQE